MQSPLTQSVVEPVPQPGMAAIASTPVELSPEAAAPDGAAVGSGGHPVRVIRGESLRTNTEINEGTALIDWLAFTVPYGSDRDWRWMRTAHEKIFDIPPEAWQGTNRQWSGYKHRVDLLHPGQRGESINLGLFAWGGDSQKGTLHTSLNAQGCARITDWSLVRDWIETVGAVITRVDCAHDDFQSEVLTIEQAIEWYRDGAFNSSGRPPKARFMDDMGSDLGRTFYVGNRAYGKMVRFYEKGKKEGDPESPWMRAEVEYRNKSRLIPPEVLLNPGNYLAGAYPCLAYLSTEQRRIKTIQKSATSNYKKMVRWLRNSAGKSLNVMLQVEGTPERVLEQLRRDGAPKRLEPYVSFPGALAEGIHDNPQP